MKRVGGGEGQQVTGPAGLPPAAVASHDPCPTELHPRISQWDNPPTGSGAVAQRKQMSTGQKYSCFLIIKAMRSGLIS